MERDRKGLLRGWLRGKGFHPADTRYALNWWEEQRKAGKEPTDEQVFAIADHGYKCIVDGLQHNPVVVSHEHRTYNEYNETVIHRLSLKWAFYGALLGSGAAITISEVIKWLDFPMMQYLSSLMG